MYNADIDNCLYIIFGINLKKASITDKKLVSEILVSAFSPLKENSSINLVVKQDLWDQSDLQQLAEDGGEETYEFSVSEHRGQFKIINIKPPHLEVFRHKCWRLMDSLKGAAKK